jgi:hypothetical protein
MIPALLLAALATTTSDSETWTFDRTDRLGGHPTTVLGAPRVIDSPVGRAVAFNGIDDAIFVNVHPLAGVPRFTWEVIFRPDSGGNPAQRFFHLQEQGTETRLLFEIRIIGDAWCLDSYARSGEAGKTLIDRSKLHPLDRWYHAALVYDGRELRNYVDGELEGRGEVALAPQGQGQTSVGVRINRVDYFKGAIRTARMTRRPLAPGEFLKVKR